MNNKLLKLRLLTARNGIKRAEILKKIMFFIKWVNIAIGIRGIFPVKLI